MKLDSMYQEVILDHYKHPHGRGLRDGDAEVHHVNPTCGDEITLRVKYDGTTIEDVSYEGQGCSISQASASVLNDLLVGKELSEAQKIQETFLELMQSKGRVEPDDAMEEVLEDAIAFAGCLQVPGTGQVRPPELDGVEGRDGPGAGRRGRKEDGMSETVEMKPASEDEVREALYDVVDPELGIDVVNLGLIYGIHIDDANIATIDMTLTSAACPLTDVIEDQAKSATDGLVNELRINWVWMPPWGPDKITDDGREQLRALGFNV